MEERGQANKHAGETEETATRTRIFVGGLGESVTEGDMLQTFSSMGKVESVEIVRTKGRSFAYLDFLPSSDKALCKLFSTYNGCMWKGGRLRLEKAKEHYLHRLKHEWAEEIKLVTDMPTDNVDATENVHPKKVSGSEKMQLRILFPKLKKVKPIPFSGSGKHKYSFQRLEASPLPVHFCDCEEHSGPAETAKVKPPCVAETIIDVVNEEEFNMMNSVMTKLFEREHCSKVVCPETGLSPGEDNTTNLINDQLVDENEAESISDEDNLIINIVGRELDRESLSRYQSQKSIISNQDNQGSVYLKSQTSKIGQPSTKHENQNTQVLHSKKRKLPANEEGDRTKIVAPSFFPETKWTVEASLKASKTVLDTRIKRPELGTQQLSDGVSWLQKSAWRDLVAVKDSNSFQISDIMPSQASSTEVRPRLDDLILNDHSDEVNHHLLEQDSLENQQCQFVEPKELPKSNIDIKQSGRGASWLSKSSWTELIADANKSSFSISQILPNVSFQEEARQTKSAGAANSMDRKPKILFNLERDGSADDVSGTLGAVEKRIVVASPGSNVVASPRKEHNPSALNVGQINPEMKRESGVLARKEQLSTPNQASRVDLGIGEPCTFMKSDASLREWMKVKAALSGQLKEKRSGKQKPGGSSKVSS